MCHILLLMSADECSFIPSLFCRSRYDSIKKNIIERKKKSSQPLGIAHKNSNSATYIQKILVQRNPSAMHRAHLL
jgi:hypothetical protein